MKHIHALLMTALVSTSALAADPVEPGAPVPEAHRTLLGISVLPLFGNGVVAVAGERVVGPRLSVGLGLQASLNHLESQPVFPETGDLGSKSGVTSYLFGVEPMARVFLTGTAPEGLWVSPRLGLFGVGSKSETEGEPTSNLLERRGWNVRGSALLGYSAIVGRGLAVQFGAGLEAQYNRSTSTSRLSVLGPVEEPVEVTSRDRAWSVGERLDLSVGWAF